MKKQEKKIKNINIIKEYINENKKQYFVLAIMFLIGIIISIIVINNMQIDSEEYKEISIIKTINSLKENYEIDNIELLKDITIKNIIFVFVMWFLGCSLIGIPIIYVVVIYKGFSLGYTISLIIVLLGTGKGILFSTITLLLQNIIIIPAILTLAVSGINLYKVISKNRKIESVKLSILKHTIISLFVFITLLIATLIEVYISNYILKICIGYF